MERFLRLRGHTLLLFIFLKLILAIYRIIGLQGRIKVSFHTDTVGFSIVGTFGHKRPFTPHWMIVLFLRAMTEGSASCQSAGTKGPMMQGKSDIYMIGSCFCSDPRRQKSLNNDVLPLEQFCAFNIEV